MCRRMQIDKSEVRIILRWYNPYSYGKVVDDTDRDLASKLVEYLCPEEEGVKNGERATENNQRKQTD